MIKVSITGVKEAMAALGGAEKQVRFAASLALNNTAKHAQAAVQQEMARSFDRPTPFTLRSVRVRFSNRTDLAAWVYFGDRLIGGGNSYSPQQILGHEFTGGSRTPKRLEQILRRAGLISAAENVVPGAAARLDRYGNMSRGQVQQILAQLSLGLDPASYKTKSARSQRNVRRAGRMFWSRGGALPRGVWVDQGGSVGVRPLLVVVRGARYRQRLNFYRTVEEAFNQKFGAEFAFAWRHAQETAR